MSQTDKKDYSINQAGYQLFGLHLFLLKADGNTLLLGVDNIC